MYSFEGDFRSKPKQSLGGASRKLKRDELLQKVAEERRNREDTKRRQQAVMRIQGFVRGTLTRINRKHEERNEFDKSIKNHGEKCEDPILLRRLLQKLLFFYSPRLDSQRLTWLSQLYLKKSQIIAEMITQSPSDNTYRLLRLLRLNIDSLVASIEHIPLATPLRLIEVFTDPNSYPGQKDPNILQKMWTYLIRKGYYHYLKTVLERRVPDTLEISPQPPTPLASSLLNLFVRPLTIPGTVQFRSVMIRALLADVFSEPLPPQVSSFLLPALSERKDILPLSDLLAALIDPNASYLRKPSKLTVPPTLWLLYSFLTLTSKQIGLLNGELVVDYLQVLQCLAPMVQSSQAKVVCDVGEESSDEEDAEKMETDCDLKYFVDESVRYLNEVPMVSALSNAAEDSSLNVQCLVPLCSVCYTMLTSQKLAIHRLRLLYTLALRSNFLRLLWQSIEESTAYTVPGGPVPLLQIISRGSLISSDDRDWFLPQLIVFCAFFGNLLPTLHDNEFYSPESFVSSKKTMPFSLHELSAMGLILRDVCLGWIELAYPNTRHSLNADYKRAVQDTTRNLEFNDDSYALEVSAWLRLFKEASGLLRQLYVRDSRRQYCPDRHWIASFIYMPVDKPCDLHLGEIKLRNYKPFLGMRSMTREEQEMEGPPISIIMVRYLKVLQELPFVVSFPARVKIFQAIVAKDKRETQGDMHNFMMGPLIQVLIRRNYIYEDAFDKLSLTNEPNLKLRMRIQLVNVIGLDEAGIDGGGIFREFLSELLKTAFDPNRGFFKTTHDRLLYPNPGVSLLVEDFHKHYYFIGRMLGKAIYENMLVELPFATFFLAKILGRTTGDVDIHNLASLDPVMYRNLLYLKTYEGDVSELGLDFTVMNSELGENQIVELKENGCQITVTASNRIEYIHLVADYKLNKQIRAQCSAFKQGLANVIDMEWLQMFDPRELQVLVSGAHVPVDVTDLRAHTNYSGGYGPDHIVIQAFWKVVENFTEKQRRQLLKFVTSCSRPPLLGFKELSPAFCIQNAGSEADRLPTASTCMNLLKLPEFKDEKNLKSKLLYAIESGAGFELS